MSTARLDDDFWTDPKLKSMLPEDKLLFIWLFTNPYRNYSGLYSLPKPMISKQTGLSDRSIDRGIKTLMDTNLIYYDADLEIVFVKNMLKRQMGSSEKLSDQQEKGIIRHLKTLHNCQLIQMFLEVYAHLNINYLYEPSDTPIDTPIYTNSHSHSHSHSNSNSQEQLPLSTAEPVDDSNGFNLESLANLWNEYRPPEIARVKIPFIRNNKILKKYKSIIRLHNEEEWWIELFKRIHLSKYMKGFNKNGWRATFDWIMENAEKVYDGHLIDAGVATQGERSFATAQQWVRDREAKRNETI